MPVTKFRKKAQSKPVRHDETRGFAQRRPPSRAGATAWSLRIPRHAAERLHLKAGQQSPHRAARPDPSTITHNATPEEWTEAQLASKASPPQWSAAKSISATPSGKEVW